MEHNEHNHHTQLAYGTFGAILTVTAAGLAGKRYHSHIRESKEQARFKLLSTELSKNATRQAKYDTFLKQAELLNEKKLRSLRPVVLAAAAFAIKHAYFKMHDIKTSLVDINCSPNSSSQAVMHLQDKDLIVATRLPDQQPGTKAEWHTAGEALLWAAEQPELFGEFYDLTHIPDKSE
jgi:hypothetical protein